MIDACKSRPNITPLLSNPLVIFRSIYCQNWQQFFQDPLRYGVSIKSVPDNHTLSFQNPNRSFVVVKLGRKVAEFFTRMVVLLLMGMKWNWISHALQNVSTKALHSLYPLQRQSIMQQHVCFPSLPPMLLYGFESRLGLESSGCSVWHFLKLIANGFNRVLWFPSLLHRLMVQLTR